MAQFSVKIIIPRNLHRPKQSFNLQRTPSKELLTGAALKGSVELIDQGLDHRLKNLRASFQQKFAQFDFQLVELLAGWRLAQKQID